MFLEKCEFKGTFRKYQAEVLKEFDKHIKDKNIKVVIYKYKKQIKF